MYSNNIKMKQENQRIKSEQDNGDNTAIIKQEADYSEFNLEEEILTEETSNDYEINLLFQNLTENVSKTFLKVRCLKFVNF